MAGQNKKAALLQAAFKKKMYKVKLIFYRL